MFHFFKALAPLYRTADIEQTADTNLTNPSANTINENKDKKRNNYWSVAT